MDWIGGVGERGPSDMLWQDYEPSLANDESARPGEVPGPSELISPWGLPLLNTVYSSLQVLQLHLLIMV